MGSIDALSTAAQVAVALAGFAGVVAAFRGGSVHSWTEIDKFRLHLLLMNALLPLALCMIAMLLLTAEPVPTGVWRWCSALAAVLLFPRAGYDLKAFFRLPPGQMVAGSAPTFYIGVSIGLAMSLLQIYNAVILNAFWAFFAAIVSQLLAGMYQFVRFVRLGGQQSP